MIAYNLRGETIISPLSSVLMIHPGEVHSAKLLPGNTWGDLRTLLIPAETFHLLQESAMESVSPPSSFPPAVRPAYPCLSGTTSYCQGARDLLQAGQKPVEVALATGCADQAHFTRMVRRTVGVAPSFYLRSKFIQDTLPHRLNIARLVHDLWPHVEILDGDTELFPGVRRVVMPGHTPGH